MEAQTGHAMDSATTRATPKRTMLPRHGGALPTTPAACSTTPGRAFSCSPVAALPKFGRRLAAGRAHIVRPYNTRNPSHAIAYRGHLEPCPAAADRPTHPHQKHFPQENNEITEEARNWRPILGTQTFLGVWVATKMWADASRRPPSSHQMTLTNTTTSHVTQKA